MSWLYLILGLAAVCGTPLFAVLGGIALLSFCLADIDSSSVIVELMRLTTAPTLVAIPLFTFAGYLLAKSRAPQRLVLFYRAWFGWLPAGLPLAALVACAFFTAFTGASGVTIIALGGLLFPILRHQNYSEKFSLGLITTSGSLGLLFAPSLPIILYGVVSGTPIDQLFLGGLIPGFLLILLLALYGGWIARKHPSHRQAFQLSVGLLTFKKALGELLLPAFLIVSIYGGFATITEVAALTVLYVLLLEIVGHRDISYRDLPGIASESMVLVGGIFIILGCALGLTNYLIDARVPLVVLDWMRQYITSPLTFLLVLNLFLLVIGCLMDIFSAIIVVVPLILPLAQAFGIHPVHLGIVFLTNLEIGYLTPPVGLNLFVSAFRFRKPLAEVYHASWPFLLVLLVGLLLITYVPLLTLVFLP